MNIREVGYFNEERFWSFEIPAAWISLIMESPLDADHSYRKISICSDEADKNSQITLNVPFPTRCIQAPAIAPEPFFPMGQKTLEEGHPYLLFAANKIFEVKNYAWDVEAIAKSQLWATVATLRDSIEMRELAKQVENLLAATSNNKAPSRQQIPDDVKLAVWHRDGQACVVCQSKQELQFDHIIPFALGGGSTVENIQLLCRNCNLTKSDNLIF